MDDLGSNNIHGKVRSRAVLFLLLVILLLGAVIRGIYVVEITGYPGFTNPLVDALYHDYWARSHVSGSWTPPAGLPDPGILERPYLRPPGYTWFLAGIYQLTGGSYLAPRLVQLFLGLLSVFLSFLLGRKLSGDAAGLVSAAMMSLSWPVIYFEGELLEPPLVIALFLLLMLNCSQWLETKSPLRAMVSGILLGVACLVRPNSLILVPVLAAWFCWASSKEKGTRDLVRTLAVFALGLIVTIGPVTGRNYLVSREPVLISSNLGINLYLGNNPEANGYVMDTVPGLGSYRTCFDYPAIVEELGAKLGRTLTDSEASSYFARQAVTHMVKNPVETIGLTGKRLMMLIGPSEISHNREIELDRARSQLLRVLPSGFAVFLALAGSGLFLALVQRGDGRPLNDERSADRLNRGKDLTVLMLGGLALLLMSYLPFFAASRYRIPGYPLVFLLGSAGLLRIVRAWNHREFKGFILGMGSFLLLVILLSVNFIGYGPDAAKWHYDEGVAYKKLGDLALAANEFGRAVEIDAGFMDAYLELGILRADEGRLDEARKLWLESMNLAPEDPRPFYNLGKISLMSGDYTLALEYYLSGMEKGGDDWRVHYDTGAAYLLLDRISEAEEQFSTALELAPDSGELKRLIQEISHWYSQQREFGP